MMEFKKKSDVAYATIKEEILNGNLPLGSKLAVSKLAKDYHLSTMPVREALTLLKQEGLVSMEPNVGASVTIQNYIVHMDNMLNRTALESQAIKLSAHYITQTAVSRLTDIRCQMITEEKEKNYSKFSFLNDEFYACIFHSVPIDELKTSWDIYVEKTKIYNIFLINRYYPATLNSIFMEQLIEALGRHDSESASKFYHEMQLEYFEIFEKSILLCLSNANIRLPREFLCADGADEVNPEEVKKRLRQYYHAREKLL